MNFPVMNRHLQTVGVDRASRKGNWKSNLSTDPKLHAKVLNSNLSKTMEIFEQECHDRNCVLERSESRIGGCNILTSKIILS